MTGGLSGAGESLGTVLWFGLLGMLVAWALAAIVFCIGLLFIGLPVWAGLDRLGWMSPGVAVVAGAALATLIGGAIGGLWFALFLLLPGAVAGWTLHRIAYGKPAGP